MNISILLLMFIWLRRQVKMPFLGRLVLPLLALKLLACWLSVRWFLSDDARYFLGWARQLTRQLWASPTDWLQTLWGESFAFQGRQLLFHGYSNTFFLIKVLSVLNLASLGNALLNGIYLSLFGFVGFWCLVRTLAHVFPTTPSWAAVVGFCLWPTTVYWTAGITKESLLVGSAAWLLAEALESLYGRRAWGIRRVIGLLLLAILQFKMRFFFAVVLLGALVGMALNRLLQRWKLGRWRITQVVVFACVLTAGLWTASEISAVFRFNKFSSQLIRTYSDLLAVSKERPHLEYRDLAPTAGSIALNTPQAVLGTLARPFPWEDSRGTYIWAGLENMLLLALLCVSLVAVARRRAGNLPFAVVLALGFYCFVLAALLGLSTPNLGTLNRYRAALLPFLVLLLLQNDYVVRWQRRLLAFLTKTPDLNSPQLGPGPEGV